MSLHKNYDDNQPFMEFNIQEDPAELSHKRHLRQMIEDKLERKRLKEEVEDELTGEFDWDDFL